MLLGLRKQEYCNLVLFRPDHRRYNKRQHWAGTCEGCVTSPAACTHCQGFRGRTFRRGRAFFASNHWSFLLPRAPNTLMSTQRVHRHVRPGARFVCQPISKCAAAAVRPSCSSWGSHSCRTYRLGGRKEVDRFHKRLGLDGASYHCRQLFQAALA